MTYESHQKLSTRLLSDLETPPPPGFQKVTYSQIRAAGEKAWDLLAKATRKGIVDAGNGRTNVDEAMDGALADLRFTTLLFAQAKANRRWRTSEQEDPVLERRQEQGPRRLRRQGQ